ncbi:hypothetical protein, partial [Sansalvadorimonas verongulae]|uniref:hypothetical protein n=1 Tax=Sansalvadorimonas verongulae TaxID=2172824 RepID=UPI001E65C970
RHRMEKSTIADRRISLSGPAIQVGLNFMLTERKALQFQEVLIILSAANFHNIVPNTTRLTLVPRHITT